MSAVDREAPASSTLTQQPVAAGSALGLAPVSLDPELDGEHRLPSDHPAWARDRLSLSARAREFIAKLKPVALRVLTFWDHHVRSIRVMGRTLSVDTSGSYRLD